MNLILFMDLEVSSSQLYCSAQSTSSLFTNPHTLKLHRICSPLPFQLVCVAEIKASLLPRILGVLFIFHYGFVRARQSLDSVGEAFGSHLTFDLRSRPNGYLDGDVGSAR